MLRRFSIATLVCLTGCFPTINQDQLVRLAASHDVAEAKWPFGDPLFFKLGDDSVLFYVQPEGKIGVQGMEDLRSEVADRMDGIVAGYRWASENEGYPPGEHPSKSEFWRKGFFRGYLVQREEAGPK